MGWWWLWWGGGGSGGGGGGGGGVVVVGGDGGAGGLCSELDQRQPHRKEGYESYSTAPASRTASLA